MNKEEKTITLGNELYEEFIEGKQTIDTHELLNLFAKRINNLQSKIDKAIEYIEKSMNNPQPFYEYLFGDENGKVENLDKLLNILKEDK